MNLTFYNTFPDFAKKGFDLGGYINTFLTSNVIINASYSDAYCPMHRTTFTIKSVFKGEEYYVTKKTKYKVTEKNFLLFNALQEHESYIDSQERIDSFSIFFSPEYIENVFSAFAGTSDSLACAPNKIYNNSQTFPFIEKLYDKDRLTQYHLSNIKKSLTDFSENENFIQEQIYFLLEHLYYSQKKVLREVNNLEPLRKSTKLELYKRLNMVKDYIESCYNEKLNLADLAKAACISEHHMLREFKKYFKVTPYQYLMNVRLEESASLLKKDNKSISEISEAIGFEYLSSFSQAFKEKYKISPNEYRDKASKKVNFK
jgi:AraC-like DNA-binding protein